MDAFRGFLAAGHRVHHGFGAVKRIPAGKYPGNGGLKRDRVGHKAAHAAEFNALFRDKFPVRALSDGNNDGIAEKRLTGGFVIAGVKPAGFVEYRGAGFKFNARHPVGFVDKKVFDSEKINFGSGDHLFGLEINSKDLKKIVDFKEVDVAQG